MDLNIPDVWGTRWWWHCREDDGEIVGPFDGNSVGPLVGDADCDNVGDAVGDDVVRRW